MDSEDELYLTQGRGDDLVFLERVQDRQVQWPHLESQTLEMMLGLTLPMNIIDWITLLVHSWLGLW